MLRCVKFVQKQFFNFIVLWVKNRSHSFLVSKSNRCTEFQSGTVVMTVCYQALFAPSSKRSSQLHKTYQCWCTAKNSWWWSERLPETCRFVIPIKLEFSASVGFIHKEFVTMHGHTFLKIAHTALLLFWSDKLYVLEEWQQVYGWH
jgi:hypothetical protein